MEFASKPSPKGKAQLDGRQSEFDFIIENMRQGLWRLNPFGIIEYVNPYLAEWLETTPEEMVGKHFSRFRSLRSLGSEQPEHSLSQRYEAEFYTPSGIARRAIVVTSPAVDSNGAPVGTVDLITDITAEHAVKAKLAEEMEKISILARTDPLTGTANRLAFDESLRKFVGRVADEPFGLVLADVDGFKNINDVEGHEFGDRVLAEVAERIKSAVRENDVVARFGGDEFAVLLPNTLAVSVSEVMERLEERLRFKRAEQLVTVSIGACHSDEDLDSILSAADKEMYRSKRERRKLPACG